MLMARARAWAEWICNLSRPTGQPANWPSGQKAGCTGVRKAPRKRGFSFSLRPTGHLANWPSGQKAECIECEKPRESRGLFFLSFSEATALHGLLACSGQMARWPDGQMARWPVGPPPRDPRPAFQLPNVRLGAFRLAVLPPGVYPSPARYR